MGSKLILNNEQPRLRSVEVDQVTIGNVPNAALGSDLLLDVEIKPVGSKEVLGNGCDRLFQICFTAVADRSELAGLRPQTTHSVAWHSG